MNTKSWLSTFLCLLAALTIAVNVHAINIPEPKVTEDDLVSSPLLEAYYNAHLDKTAYYPSMNEEDLVVLGSAYLAPLFVIEDGQPVLYLNAIVALRDIHFGFHRIEFDFTKDEVTWDVEAHNASSDGFIADEVYLKADERMIQSLMLITAQPLDEYHVSFWGHSDQPLHFALTRNQIKTIQDFMSLYFGIETVESVSI